MNEELNYKVYIVTGGSRGFGLAVARSLVEDWDKALSQFVKVMPTDYKRVLMEMKKQQEQAVA